MPQTSQSIFEPHLPRSERERSEWPPLPATSRALAISAAALKHQGLTLVVCEDSGASLQLEDELQFFCANETIEVLHLPDWETLPYDSFSPHQDIISDRLQTLHRLHNNTQSQHAILVVPISAMMQTTTAPEYITKNSLVLAQGQSLQVKRFRQSLIESGYNCVESVFEHGEFAVRGSIIDLFPMGSDAPVRIELFDDEVESLRFFDTESQRTTEKLENISLLPAKEFPLDSEGIARFRRRWHESFSVDHSACTVYQDISAGLASAGIEYYLPLFFDRRYSLLDHLSSDVLLITEPDIHGAAESFLEEVVKRFEEYGIDRTRPLLPPEQVFLRVEELFSAFKGFKQVALSKPEGDIAETTASACQRFALLSVRGRGS